MLIFAYVTLLSWITAVSNMPTSSIEDINALSLNLEEYRIPFTEPALYLIDGKVIDAPPQYKHTPARNRSFKKPISSENQLIDRSNSQTHELDLNYVYYKLYQYLKSHTEDRRLRSHLDVIKATAKELLSKQKYTVIPLDLFSNSDSPDSSSEDDVAGDRQNVDLDEHNMSNEFEMIYWLHMINKLLISNNGHLDLYPLENNQDIAQLLTKALSQLSTNPETDFIHNTLYIYL